MLMFQLRLTHSGRDRNEVRWCLPCVAPSESQALPFNLLPQMLVDTAYRCCMCFSALLFPGIAFSPV